MSGIRERIEIWFESFGRLVYRRRVWALLIMLVLVGALAYKIPQIKFDTSTEGFFHETDPAMVTYNDFRRQFGRDELIIIAIKPPEVFSLEFLNKLKAFHQELEERVPHVEEITSLLNARNTRGEGDRLIVGDFLEDWPQSEEDLAVLKERALANHLYINRLISEEADFTTVVIRTDTYSSLGREEDPLAGFEEPAGTGPPEDGELPPFLSDQENSEVINAVRQVISEFETDDFQIYLAGTPVMTDTLKRSMVKDIKRFVKLVLLVIAVFLLIMFRRLTGVLLPLLIVAMALISTLGLMSWLGAVIKLPTAILPSFLMAVGVGAAVHVLSMFYQELEKTGDRQEAISQALGHSGLAIVMTSLTTAAGLASFAHAKLAPIAELGQYASVGIMLCLVYTIVLLPCLLSLIPVKPRGQGKTRTGSSLMDRFLTGVAELAVRRYRLITFFTVAVISVCLLGAFKLHFTHNLLIWFPDEIGLRQDTETIDHNLRGSVTLEVVIDTGRENGLYDAELLKTMDALASELEKYREGDIFVGKATSVADMLKEIHKALNENRPEFYAIPDNQALIPQEFLLFENSGSDDLEDVVDSQFSQARFTIKAPWRDAVKYWPFMQRVAGKFEEAFEGRAKITLTGMMSLLARTVYAAIHSAAQSYVIAGAVITLMMILLIGSVRLGLLSMVPNLLPIVLTMGLMGWLNFPLDMFTMLIGSIAIGLAVDDTVHFMHNFRRYHNETGDVGESVRLTLNTTGRAMLVTSIVLSLGIFRLLFRVHEKPFLLRAPDGGDHHNGPGRGFFDVPRPDDFVLPPKSGEMRRYEMMKVKMLSKIRFSRAAGLAVVLLAAALVFGPVPARADDAKAREIMLKVDAREDGDNSTADMQMILIDKSNRERVRTIKSFSKDKGQDTWRLMFFLEPADVKDTAFLTYDYDDPNKDDDQWMYLPALKKTKRIASSDKSSPFMGSDFSYADMTKRSVDNYNYKLLKEDEVRGQKVWVIEAEPKTKRIVDQYGYDKSVLFVRQDNYVVVRGVNWVNEGGKLKYMDAKQIEQIDGIWVVTEMLMTTKKSKQTLHSTVIKMNNVKFNQDLSEDLFTVRRMEKGL